MSNVTFAAFATLGGSDEGLAQLYKETGCLTAHRAGQVGELARDAGRRPARTWAWLDWTPLGSRMDAVSCFPPGAVGTSSTVAFGPAALATAASSCFRSTSWLMPAASVARLTSRMVLDGVGAGAGAGGADAPSLKT